MWNWSDRCTFSSLVEAPVNLRQKLAGRCCKASPCSAPELDEYQTRHQSSCSWRQCLASAAVCTPGGWPASRHPRCRPWWSCAWWSSLAERRTFAEFPLLQACRSNSGEFSSGWGRWIPASWRHFGFLGGGACWHTPHDTEEEEESAGLSFVVQKHPGRWRPVRTVRVRTLLPMKGHLQMARTGRSLRRRQAPWWGRKCSF